ncbi:MAG: YHS domain-containing protein [Saprospiraceae bacterium]|nr:YHS domain-containing protein [Saprospiraceae bacterium]
MKFRVFLSLFALVFALASCQQPSQPQSGSTPKAEAVALASDTDPVCGMKVDASVTDTAHYQGKIYGFCNPSCKEEFAANPQEFLSSSSGQ